MKYLVVSVLIAATCPAFGTCNDELMDALFDRVRESRRLEQRAADYLSFVSPTQPHAVLAFIGASAWLQKTEEDWVRLIDIRHAIGVGALDKTSNRLISEIFRHHLWDEKVNPAKRSEKLVRLTLKGRQILDNLAANL